MQVAVLQLFPGAEIQELKKIEDVAVTLEKVSLRL